MDHLNEATGVSFLIFLGFVTFVLGVLRAFLTCAAWWGEVRLKNSNVKHSALRAHRIRYQEKHETLTTFVLVAATGGVMGFLFGFSPWAGGFGCCGLVVIAHSMDLITVPGEHLYDEE